MQPRKFLQAGLLFIFLTGFIACRQTDDSPLPMAEEFSADNLSYGSDPRNRMDVRLPEGRNENTPILVLIHGGAWIDGDKKDLEFIQDSLLREGIGSASINYRYVNADLHYETLMKDIDKAIDYCVANSDKWQIRETDFLLGGFSAGAHMALLYAYGYDPEGRISGLISGSGPTDFTDTDWLDYALQFGLLYAIEWLAGADYVPGQPLDNRFISASPVMQTKDVPTLLIHGDQDAVVFYSQSLRLRDTLEVKGFTSKLVTIPGANHDLSMTNPAIQAQILKEMRDWCHAHSQ